MSALATAYHTDRGLRPSNQDAVAAAVLPDGREVVAVADGMGGHAAGEVASATAVAALIRALEGGAGLEEAYQAADRAVRAAAAQDPSLQGMGTTLVVLLHEGSAYRVANVGDSRAYRVSREGIAQITRDHSFSAEAVRAGQMSAEEIARSPWRNALTRALGTEEELLVDLFGPFDTADPHAVLLCSDGLHGVVGDEEIRASILGSDDVHAVAGRLSSLALRNGSRDNVTVALRDFGLLLREAPRIPVAPAGLFPSPGEAPHPGPPARPAPPRRRRAKRKLPLPGEGALFAACCLALLVWLAYFLTSF